MMAFMISNIVSFPIFAPLEPKKINLQFLGSNSTTSITSFSTNVAKRSNITCLHVSASKHLDNQTLEYHDTSAYERTIERQRNKLQATGESLFDCLDMIDVIQRLVIDHHFQHEIEEILRKLYRECSLSGDYGRNLHEVSLCFRLLRQEGYLIPESIFNKFKDMNGEFKEDIKEDTKGLMGLFEASHLSIEGEETLDQAREFALKELSKCQKRYKSRAVQNVLDRPHHISFSRLMANEYMNTILTSEEKEWVRCLQEVAKIDFNIVQVLHQEEISKILRWWRELGLAKELTKARDQPLKWHAWSMAVFDDPNLSQQRLDLTKSISFIYILDDIFDVYGGLDELTLFTEYLNRWDYDGLEELPNHMKVCFEGLDIITTEISLKVYGYQGWNPINYLRKSWTSLCKAFLVEAKWFASGYLPDKEEYLKNGILSSGAHVVMLHVFFLLNQETSKENVEFAASDDIPKIVSSTATILRLWDDLGTAKDENQDGYDGSYLKCYMKQHEGSTIEEARKHVALKISDAWKSLNEECLFRRPFSRSFSKACLNLARMVPLMYTYDDHHNLPVFEEYMNSLMLH